MAYIRRSVREKMLQAKRPSVSTPTVAFNQPTEHKYIVYERNSHTMSIVFSKEEIHREVGDFIRYKGGRILSAGFVRINEYEILCYGRSESLDICSQRDDAKYITTKV